MLFNSFEFLLFFITVAFTYFLIKDKWRWAFLLGASYFFYGSWNTSYLILILLSTVTTFYSGILIEKIPNQKKIVALSSLTINLGILFFFKYYNFFATTVNSLSQDTLPFFDTLLPVVGISFYTFQALSYTMDVYNGKIQSQKHIGKYALFVSFFPQLVAGPIEKASNLLPQFSESKLFNYERVRSGLLLIVWGIFKKVVIADRIGVFVSEVYNDPSESYGVINIIATVLFSFQLYLDFSSYSEIAIGSARVFGYKLSTNFKRPYLSVSFKEFWKRWHITLNSWFFEYLYLPLGGNKKKGVTTIRNIIIIFLISGLWHGASWNFVIWGGINSIYLLVIDRLLQSKKKKKKKLFGKMFFGTIIMLLWSASLVFFRANTFEDAMVIYSNMNFSGIENLYAFGLNKLSFYVTIRLLVLVYIIELFQEIGFTENKIFNAPIILRWIIYLILPLSTLYFGAYGLESSDSSFIYFQF